MSALKAPFASLRNLFQRIEVFSSHNEFERAFGWGIRSNIKMIITAYVQIFSVIYISDMI